LVYIYVEASHKALDCLTELAAETSQCDTELDHSNSVTQQLDEEERRRVRRLHDKLSQVKVSQVHLNILEIDRHNQLSQVKVSKIELNFS